MSLNISAAFDVLVSFSFSLFINGSFGSPNLSNRDVSKKSFLFLRGKFDFE